mgnify:CR=1 FL=1
MKTLISGGLVLCMLFILVASIAHKQEQISEKRVRCWDRGFTDLVWENVGWKNIYFCKTQERMERL